jgi:hypothetical protein
MRRSGGTSRLVAHLIVGFRFAHGFIGHKDHKEHKGTFRSLMIVFALFVFSVVNYSWLFQTNIYSPNSWKTWERHCQAEKNPEMKPP